MAKEIILATDEYCRQLVRDLYAPAITCAPKINVLSEDYELMKRSESLEHGFQRVMALVQVRGITVEANAVQLESYVASKLLYFSVKEDNKPTIEIFLVEKHGADPRTEDIQSKETALTCAMLKTKDYRVVKRLCGYVTIPRELNGDFSTIGHILFALNDDQFDHEDLIRVLRLAYDDIDLFFP